MKEEKRYKIEEYVVSGRKDIYFYAVLTVIFFLILFFISYKVNWYYWLLFDLLMVFITIDKIFIYYDLKKIEKYLIDNNLINKIGKVYYYNSKNYFLMDDYMIILKNKKVYVFKYSDIVEIFKESSFSINHFTKFEEYLNIITSSGEQFQVLTFSSYLVDENFRDISTYLLEKNKKIKITESVKNGKIDVFKTKNKK